jgi:hypothetical protein
MSAERDAATTAGPALEVQSSTSRDRAMRIEAMRWLALFADRKCGISRVWAIRYGRTPTLLAAQTIS